MLKSLILPLTLMLLTYFYSTTGVSKVYVVPAVVGISAVVGFPAIVASAAVSVPTSLLLLCPCCWHPLIFL